jgi:hypothetical protein
MPIGNLAEWAVAIATILLAAVAVFQDWIRSWIFAPALRPSIVTAPPDCVWVPIIDPYGGIANTVHARVLISNHGRATALNVEVYARELRRLNQAGTWDRVLTFPPMNLTWADVGGPQVSSIAPMTAKHCDLGHIFDPARRPWLEQEKNPNLVLQPDQTTFSVATVALPNHRGNIIPPGTYRLDVVIAAENATARHATISIDFNGVWYGNEAAMLQNGLHLEILNPIQ